MNVPSSWFRLYAPFALIKYKVGFYLLFCYLTPHTPSCPNLTTTASQRKQRSRFSH